MRELAENDLIAARAGRDNLLDFDADAPQIDVEIFQHIRCNARTFLDEAEENVFRANVFVVEALGLLIGQLHHLAGTVRKTFVHLKTTPTDQHSIAGTSPGAG
jgi:hypothetical protein